jgi:enoyl-CoA hydratase/carnithine racemase
VNNINSLANSLFQTVYANMVAGLNEAAFGITPPVLPMYVAQDVLGKLRAERFLSQGTMLSAEEAFEYSLVGK